MPAKQEQPASSEQTIFPPNYLLALKICDHVTRSIGNSVSNQGLNYLRRFQTLETVEDPHLICQDPAYINNALLAAGCGVESTVREAQSRIKFLNLRPKEKFSDLGTKDRLALEKASRVIESAPSEELALPDVESQCLGRDFNQAAHTVLSLAYCANLRQFDPNEYASLVAKGSPSLVDLEHSANRDLYLFFTGLSGRYGLSKEEVYQIYHRFFYTNGFNQLLRSCSPDLWTFDRGLFALIYTYFHFQEAMPQINFVPGNPQQDRLGIDLCGKDPDSGTLYYVQVKGEAKMPNGLPLKDLEIYPLADLSSRTKLVQHIVRNAGVEDIAVITSLAARSDKAYRLQMEQLLKNAQVNPDIIDQALNQIATLDALLSQCHQDNAVPLWVTAPSVTEFLIPGISTYYEQYLKLLEEVSSVQTTRRLIQSPDYARTINYSRLDGIFNLKSHLSCLKPGDTVLNVSLGKIGPAYDKLRGFPPYAGLRFFSTLESRPQAIKDQDLTPTHVNIFGVDYLTTLVPFLLDRIEAGEIEKFSIIFADNLLKYTLEPGQDKTPASTTKLYLLSLIGSLRKGGQLLIHDDDTQRTVNKSQSDLYSEYQQIIRELPPEFIVTVETKKNRTGSYLVCTRRV